VVGPERVGCDAEAVRELSREEWWGLLGAEQLALAELIQRERGEPLSVAATRVWGTVECLRKIGRAVPGPITLAQSLTDGWVRLDSGHAKVATFVTRVRDQADLTVFTVLTEGTVNEAVLRVPAHRWFRGDQPGRERLLR
jgi:enediyne polyketide synthase